MEQRDAAVTPGLRARATHALRQRHNWEQLAKFGVVGASGYVVNLAVYAALLKGANFHYLLAATCSFVVAVTNNYVWNRYWTFRHARGHFAFQGVRFFTVALIAYVGNLIILKLLVEFGAGEIVAQAIAIVLVTPANFVGNKLWSFRRAPADL